jgi:small subunit ribosomal protein S17
MTESAGVSDININKRNMRRTVVGCVVSDKMDKTIVVLVKRTVKHKIYKKTMELSKKFKAHDESNQAKIGDVVELMETRPLSKQKCWRLVRVIKKAE